MKISRDVVIPNSTIQSLLITISFYCLFFAGPFTVFGPTDDAFANLPGWVKKEIANVTVLGEVLKFHVLSGKVESKSLKNELQVPTVEGSKLRINLYTKDSKTVVSLEKVLYPKNKVANNL